MGDKPDGIPESSPERGSPLKVRFPHSDPFEASNGVLDNALDSPELPQSLQEERKPRLSAHKGVPPSAHERDGASSRKHMGSDKHLGHGSLTGNHDRVFPIRSAVSVHPSSPKPDVSIPGRLSGEQSAPSPSSDMAELDVTQHSQHRQRTHTASSRTSPSGEDTSHPSQTQRTSSQTRSETSNSGRNVPSNRASSEGHKYGGGPRMQIFGDASSENSNERSPTSNLQSPRQRPSLRFDNTTDDIPRLVTARFKHIVTAEGHTVITGRDGDTLQRCEDEPIHIPGAIQSFGLLIALEEQESGDLIVRVVSENSKRIIGYTPQELFKLKNFSDILSEEQAENLLDHVDFIRDEEADPATNGPEVFTITIRSPRPPKKNEKLWCGMHTHPSYPNLIICEFELDEDPLYPLVPPEEVPESPEDTLESNPTKEEFSESTHVTSRPLRVLRSARKRKGEAAAMAVFNIMSQVQEQLAAAPNLDTFLKILVGVVKELTGFHRVMIYQFDSSFNGRVVTELVDPRATKDLYKGLNFPASDIPKQAREMYKVNKVRLLYDRDLETARLVCRSVEDLERPLDLTYSYLRAMSPIHIKYLKNMAVRSSMSISINAFNGLWGLIACHSYGGKGMRVSFPIRKMCRLVGDTASRNIERLSYASRLQARKLINTMPTEANPSGYIIASSDDLLKLFDADLGLLSITGETKIMGRPEQSQEALAMLEYLRMRKPTSVITSHDIRSDFPDLRYSPGFDVIAGLLLVPLSVGGTDFIVFFRKGQVKEVKWAGNPYEKFIKEGTEGYLEPRKSFKTWTERVVGKCRVWTEEQVETAAVLCLVYGKFIEVWRQKEAALQSSRLTQLLLSNSAHEVRTPLNAIINYLEIALEGALDQETRDNLAKSHSASKSLIYVINDLLDLTKAEEGQDLIKDESFDLPATVLEAAMSFQEDAKRKRLEYQVTEHPGVPQYVLGDQRRLRQAVSNIIANSVQNTPSGWIRIEMFSCGTVDGKATVEIVVQDTGVGMSNDKLDSLFRELEQVSLDDNTPIDGSEPAGSTFTPKESRSLGLGLAMVARIVHNMDAQLRLKSEAGKGTRFVIQVPFLLPDSDPNRESTHHSTVSTPPPHISEGEVLLVDKTNSRSEGGIKKRLSHGEISSLRSFRSGSSNRSNKSEMSDVDRLIDAISGSIAAGEPEQPDARLQRSNSLEGDNSHGSIRSSGAKTAQESIAYKRSGGLIRSRSYVLSEHPQEAAVQPPSGAEFIQDEKTLLRAVRMPDEFQQEDSQSLSKAPQLSFNTSGQEQETVATELEKLDVKYLQVLVAEDDPINSRIIQKRLEKSGHQVHHTINGENCASVYGSKAAFFDVVLMDMQMPIADGLTSTKMIRSLEKVKPPSYLAPRPSLNGRVPIFAVSASLVEKERNTYTNAGFDGWILKPIDFERLNVLLEGIINDEIRNACLYKPGQWERGGWFHPRQPSIISADTKPTGDTPVQLPSIMARDETSPDDSSRSSESVSEAGTITPIPPRNPTDKHPLIPNKKFDSPKMPGNETPDVIPSPAPDKATDTSS